MAEVYRTWGGGLAAVGVDISLDDPSTTPRRPLDVVLQHPVTLGGPGSGALERPPKSGKANAPHTCQMAIGIGVGN